MQTTSENALDSNEMLESKSAEWKSRRVLCGAKQRI